MKPSYLALALVFGLSWTRSADAADWSPPVAVTQSCCGAYFPFVLHDDADVHHLWWVQVDEGDKPLWRLRYARGSGGAFMPAQEIGGQLDARLIHGVHAGDALAIVFSAYRVQYGDGCMLGATGGCSDVYFVESLDAGASWSPPQPLPHPDDPAQRFEPVIVRDSGGALTIAYDRDGVLLTVTRDGGGVWGAETTVTGPYAGQQHSPELVAATSGLHLLFRARPDGQASDVLLHTRREGDTWSEPKPVTPLVGGTQLSAITSDGAQHLQVGFQYPVADVYSVYFTESLDAGGVWSAPVQLSGPGYAARPKVVRERGGHTVHTVWDRGTAIGHAEASGGGFTPELSLSPGMIKAIEPTMSAGNTELLVAWHGHSVAEAPFQIFIARRAPTDPVPVDPTTGGDDTSSGDATADPDTTTRDTNLSEGTATTPTGDPPLDPSTGGTTSLTSTGSGPPTGSGPDSETGSSGCGCHTTIGAPWWLALGLLRRRRRPPRA